MFNVAIVSVKDMIKYITTLLIAIIIVVFLAKHFLNGNQDEKIDFDIGKKVANIMKSSFTQCFGTTIPILENENKILNNSDKTNEESSDLLKQMLDVELGVINQNQHLQAKKENKEKKENKVELAEDEAKTEIVTKNPIALKSTNEYNGVKIKNESDKKLTKDTVKPNIKINNKNILIFHTHSCESYTSSKKYTYNPTGTFRTTDKDYSVVRVGEELKKYLKEYKFDVRHNTTYHDYPAYTGSYNRSLETVKKELKKKKSDVIIDLHRDAIGSKSDYAPTVKIGEDEVAQLMFVIGTNGGGLRHPNWKQNLKFAVKVQEQAEKMYPNLFKPIIVRNSRYNQHTGKAACIIEVGATGNTLEQSLTSMKYLANVLNEVMK